MNDDDTVVQLPVTGKPRRPDWDGIYLAYQQGTPFRDLARMPEAAGISSQAIHAHAKREGWVRDESAAARMMARQDVAYLADEEARRQAEFQERGTRLLPSPPKRRGRPPGSKNKKTLEEEAAALRTPANNVRHLKLVADKPAEPEGISLDDPKLNDLFDDDGEDDGPRPRKGKGGDRPRASDPVSVDPLPGDEPDPLPPAKPEDDTPARVQARNLTRIGIRQQRRITELHGIQRALVHGFKMLAALPPDDPDFAYFASKYLGPKDSLADLARKVAYVNGMLQRDERTAFDMDAARSEDLQPFVPKLGRRASPMAEQNPYRNGELASDPVTPPVSDRERFKGAVEEEDVAAG